MQIRPSFTHILYYFILNTEGSVLPTLIWWGYCNTGSGDRNVVIMLQSVFFFYIPHSYSGQHLDSFFSLRISQGPHTGAMHAYRWFIINVLHLNPQCNTAYIFSKTRYDCSSGSNRRGCLPLTSLQGRAVQLMCCWSKHMQIKQGFSSGTQLCMYCRNKIEPCSFLFVILDLNTRGSS